MGSALLETFEDVVRIKGVKSISLITLVENVNAIAFYKHIGYNGPKLILKMGSERFEFNRAVT